MSAALPFSFDFLSVTCCECGIAFAFDKNFHNRRVADHKIFYCPSGHSQHFTDKSEVERLKEQLKWSRRSADSVRSQLGKAEKSVSAYKGALTRTKNRIKNGVCPCCKRQFQNLHRHMVAQHADYTSKEANE